MGKYDSSKYRITPLVESIKNNAENFKSFIATIENIPALPFPGSENAFFYGDKEKKLNPPKEHLEALIDYMASKEHTETAHINAKRKKLFGLNSAAEKEETREEAKRLLKAKYNDLPLPKAWYIFEGATNPDIYIEGDDYVIVCEGKWTEPHITTKTTHLKADNEYRNQMVRHIQGALNATKKQVYAFYIADADCGYLNDLTSEALKEQIEHETIAPKNKEKILSSFYGYTTWQKIKSAIPSLNFMSKEEINAIKK